MTTEGWILIAIIIYLIVWSISVNQKLRKLAKDFRKMRYDRAGEQ